VIDGSTPTHGLWSCGIAHRDERDAAIHHHRQTLRVVAVDGCPGCSCGRCDGMVLRGAAEVDDELAAAGEAPASGCRPGG